MASEQANIKIEYEEDGQWFELASHVVSKLKPFEKKSVKLKGEDSIKITGTKNIKVTIFPSGQHQVELKGEMKF